MRVRWDYGATPQLLSEARRLDPQDFLRDRLDHYAPHRHPPVVAVAQTGGLLAILERPRPIRLMVPNAYLAMNNDLQSSRHPVKCDNGPGRSGLIEAAPVGAGCIQLYAPEANGRAACAVIIQTHEAAPCGSFLHTSKS